MMDPLENDLFDLPDYEHTEDERFPPLPPPLSPGAENGDLENGDDWTQNIGQTQKEEEPKPTRRASKRPQPKLDANRLTSQRGLPALRNLFDGVKFKGKGHEAEDLKTLLRHMENWAHRLFPKLRFEDFLNRLETLGGKKEVQTCLKRIRMDMPIVHDDFISEDVVVQMEDNMDLPSDDFDALPVSSLPPVTQKSTVDLSEETRKRIERNRLLALERRMAKMQAEAESQATASVLSQTMPSDTEEIPDDFDDLLEDLDKKEEITEPHQETEPIASPGEPELVPDHTLSPKHEAPTDPIFQAENLD
ncbi:TIMELESS-interacting [Pelobates cultripes]|uniref:TIMELESS-interacting protein n=1 Tax=Pelobates cultripes TaxID=61616 RepID=A0AAD1RMT5_PELCU|nr:TIMELESS-interacting [Pelobates cultripes]